MLPKMSDFSKRTQWGCPKSRFLRGLLRPPHHFVRKNIYQNKMVWGPRNDTKACHCETS